MVIDIFFIHMNPNKCMGNPGCHKRTMTGDAWTPSHKGDDLGMLQLALGPHYGEYWMFYSKAKKKDP